MLDEGDAIDLDAVIEGQAEVFGERALARSVEAGHPNAHFVFTANVHGGFHLEQQVFKLLVDAVGHHVFGDFGSESGLLRNTVGDDLFYAAMDVLGWVEKLLDVHIVIPCLDQPPT